MTTKAKQVVFDQFGSPDVLKLIETELPEPKAGEIIIQTEAIGVNYSDTLRRRNRYFQSTPLPFVLGSEVVGTIISSGPEVSEPFTLGSKVLAILPYGGGYADYVSALTQFCIPIPQAMDSKAATGIFVQGSTAQLMISQVAKDVKDKTVLITAASGGVGSLLVQLAKLNGAKVIAGSSSDEKLKLAVANGADLILNYSKPNWSAELRNFTNGKGVDIAFETVGGDVYNETIKSLATGGHLIVYGCASGVQGSIHPEYFVDENLIQSGFNLAHYISNKMPIWQEAMGQVIGMVANGDLKISTSKTFLLKDAAEAHRQVEARETTGKVILTPNA